MSCDDDNDYEDINLNDYELIHHIGSGSFGCTLLVRKKKTGSYAVLKVIVTSTPKKRIDVCQEVGIQDSLYGAGMRLFLDIYSHKEYLWRSYMMPTEFTSAIVGKCNDLAMMWADLEDTSTNLILHLVLMEPGNLQELIQRKVVTLDNVDIEYEDMRSFTFMFIHGLYDAYSSFGFIHGDLKTKNAVYSVTTEEEEIDYGEFTFTIPRGVVAPFMIDFGFSRLTEPPFSDDYGNNNPPNGTIVYMAPEVLTKMYFEQNIADLNKMDLWSLGLMLLEIAAGPTNVIVTSVYFMPNLGRTIEITKGLDASVRVFLDFYFIWAALHDVMGFKKKDFRQHLPVLSAEQVDMLEKNYIDVTNSNRRGMINMEQIERSHKTYHSRDMQGLLDVYIETYGTRFRDLLKILLAWNPENRDYDKMLNHSYFKEIRVEIESEDEEEYEEDIEKRKFESRSSQDSYKRTRLKSCISCPRKASLKCKCHQKRYCGKECAYKDHLF